MIGREIRRYCFPRGERPLHPLHAKGERESRSWHCLNLAATAFYLFCEFELNNRDDNRSRIEATALQNLVSDNILD